VARSPTKASNSSGPPALTAIEFDEQEGPVAPQATEASLRLLARLLVKAAQSGPAPDSRNPLDIASAPKVRLDQD